MTAVWRLESARLIAGLVRLTRDVGNITMDVDGMERVDVNSLGGNDVLTVDNLAATKVRTVDHDEAAVLSRVERLLQDGVVETWDGTLLPAQPQSILLHGDTPGSVALSKSLRALVEKAGWTITPISQLHK